MKQRAITTIIAAFRDGAGRVWRAPALLAGVLGLTIIMAVPPGLLVEASIASHLGRSRAADTALSGVNAEWWAEFGEQADGLAATFQPTVIGFGAVLDNLSRFLDAAPLAAPVAWLAAAYLLVWLFLLGGVLDRFARDRPTRTAAFFAACGVYFWRFLRLALVAGLVYGFLIVFVHQWLLVDLYGRLIRDLTVERTAFFLTVALYGLFVLLLGVCGVVLDYARIRTVVEDRLSVLGSLVASVRFVARNPGAVAGLVVLNSACYVLVVALYGLTAPGAGAVWTGFIIGQLYVVARLFVKLLTSASQTALFQHRLAHAGYAAAPVPRWPESATVEALANAAEDAQAPSTPSRLQV